MVKLENTTMCPHSPLATQSLEIVQCSQLQLHLLMTHHLSTRHFPMLESSEFVTTVTAVLCIYTGYHGNLAQHVLPTTATANAMFFNNNNDVMSHSLLFNASHLCPLPTEGLRPLALEPAPPLQSRCQPEVLHCAGICSPIQVNFSMEAAARVQVQVLHGLLYSFQ